LFSFPSSSFLFLFPLFHFLPFLVNLQYKIANFTFTMSVFTSVRKK
jgi:hypothetical protein